MKIQVYWDDTTIIFAWKKEFDEKEKTGRNITNHIEKTGQKRYC